MKKLFASLIAGTFLMFAGTALATDTNCTTPPPPLPECGIACQNAKLFKGHMSVESFGYSEAYGDETSVMMMNDAAMRFKQGNPDEGTGVDITTRMQNFAGSMRDDGSTANAGYTGFAGNQWQAYGSQWGSY